MKLRDRQEKVERMLTFYKTSKGNPFQNYSTNVRGEIEVAGAVMAINNIDQQQYDAVQKAGIRTGVNCRLTFETTIREKDTLVAEIVANNVQGDISSNPLSLAKVLYAANVSEWFSAVAIPVGAQFRDVAVGTCNPHQDKGLTDYSGFGPSLLNEYNGSAFGVMVKNKNIVASLGQFVSRLGTHATNSGITRCFSTFGQVVCHVSNSTKFSLLGVHKVHKVHKVSPQSACLGPMAIPMWISRQNERTETSSEGDNSPQTGTHWGEINMDGSIAITLESELDDSSRIGGWMEIKKSNPRRLQWAVGISDTPEDELGWGLNLGGLVQDAKHFDHFQAEAFLKFNLGKKFSLQPALVYVSDGSSRFPALMCRSSWSI
ncbi:hypothetical protein Leryth_006152 [Lithospermum erythrorhizon]|nr:hypothetical protein Leryth_006152 [Lithospermum erythrorhizon]